MSDFVPPDLTVPTPPAHPDFVLEPLGPQHNEKDLAAWHGSVEHIRTTPGFPDGRWPPVEGYPLERNLADLVRHASDFEDRKGFTYTVLDPTDSDVIGCVYIYPRESNDPEEADVNIRSWVVARHAALDSVLYRYLRDWLAAEWRFTHPHFPGRS